jgi:hypothetical protein
MDGKKFGSLFIRGKSREEAETGFFLSPRMAYKLFDTATYLAESFEDNPEIFGFGLPDVCQQFVRKRRWVTGYDECYKRIAPRLVKVEPCCTAEFQVCS